MENKYQEFNQEKKQAEKFSKIGLPFLLLGVVLALIGSSQQNIMMGIGIVLIIIGAIVSIIGAARFSSLKKRFKDQVLGPMFKEAIPGIEFDPNRGLDPRTVYDTDFLTRADRFTSEDYLAGDVDGVNFISSDVKLEERHVEHTKNGTRTYYVTYFLGRVFKFDFNKEFVGDLHVLEAGRPKSRGFNKVKLESVDFNKKFKTFTQEDITAFYVLTPPIIEAITKIEKRHPGRIGISFRGDHMYVAINNNKDTFELKMFKEIDDSMIQEFIDDLLVIKEFIVTLKLNKNLFKK